MSTVNRHDVKITLPRTGTDPLWQQLLTEFAIDDPLRWKYLAMLALRENSGWSMQDIGFVFGHSKGHVSRCLANIKRQVRKHLEAQDDDRREAA